MRSLRDAQARDGGEQVVVEEGAVDRAGLAAEGRSFGQALRDAVKVADVRDKRQEHERVQQKHRKLKDRLKVLRGGGKAGEGDEAVVLLGGGGGGGSDADAESGPESDGASSAAGSSSTYHGPRGPAPPRQPQRKKRRRAAAAPETAGAGLQGKEAAALALAMAA